MENDYYSKYLKYKTKYIQLKEQMVGASGTPPPAEPKIDISNCTRNETTGTLNEGNLTGVKYTKLLKGYKKEYEKNGMNQITYINKKTLQKYTFSKKCEFIETYINKLTT